VTHISDTFRQTLKEKIMSNNKKVAEALVTAGYLTEADLDAAADVLADALIVEAANEVEAAAADDYSEQEDLIAEAEVWEAEDSLAGDIEGAVLDDDIIADAEIQKEIDKEVVLEAEDVIAAAYLDAAAALVAAEIIDEANLSPVAAIIADVWVVEEDVD
jgi:hypothetical protein